MKVELTSLAMVQPSQRQCIGLGLVVRLDFENITSLVVPGTWQTSNDDVTLAFDPFSFLHFDRQQHLQGSVLCSVLFMCKLTDGGGAFSGTKVNIALTYLNLTASQDTPLNKLGFIVLKHSRNVSVPPAT